VLALAGLFVSFAGAGVFMQHRTAIIPFKPASSLVTAGIYGWTRNPMYLGMALTYVGLAVLSNSLSAMVLLPVVLLIIQLQVIAREEAYLERAFGSAYAAYKKQVRRWI
jgi:protein-S-isoprenylcysteine O-methyltransferase Ste14